uniref:YqaA family protein n=1 Tax=Thaumasiovibrio occultus TaxID=1891184 RepID=UPI000B350926|nr:YqaA family protein [Thaumasiovibrio occultus]
MGEIGNTLAALVAGEHGLWLLGFTGFFSATLLPGGSEAAMLTALHVGQHSPAMLVLVATIGNTLGGMTNYWLGRLLPDKTSEEKHGHKAMQWLQRYGIWALLLSWLPVIGDPLCVAAGWLRMNQWGCTVLIAIGKCLRYAVLALMFYGIIG